MDIDTYIIPTYKCNLNCKFCFAGDFINTTNQYFWDESIFDDFFEEAILYNWKYSITIGWGEPLLNIDFLERFYEYIVSKKITWNINRVNIVTNGVFLKNIKKLKIPKDFFVINLSLHWFERSHEFLVGKSWIWKDIIRNILELNKLWYKFDIGIVVNNINIQETPKLIEFLYKIGFKQFHIIFYHYIGNALKNQKYLFLDFFWKHSLLIEDMRNWISKKKGTDMTINVVNNFPYCKFDLWWTFEKEMHIKDVNYHFKIRKWYYSKTYKEEIPHLLSKHKDDKKFFISSFKLLLDENIERLQFLEICKNCSYKRKCNLVLDSIDAVYYKNIYNLPTSNSDYFKEVSKYHS